MISDLAGLQNVCILLDFFIYIQKTIKIHRGNTVLCIVTIKIYEHLKPNKNRITQAVILHSLTFLVFSGRVESLHVGTSVDGGGRRKSRICYH